MPSNPARLPSRIARQYSLGATALVLLLCLAMFPLGGRAQTSTTATPAPATAVPPILLKPAVAQAKLPIPPAGFAWQRLADMEVAVLTPEDWVDTPQLAEFTRGHTFSIKPSGQKGEFRPTLTARLLWHPQFMPGYESKAMDAQLVTINDAIERNKKLQPVLHSSREVRAGKFVMTMRYRIAPPGAAPAVAHMVAIGDPNTGFVYQFSFECLESDWDTQWKIGEQIFAKLLILFQRG
jgi:hypothetical protein